MTYLFVVLAVLSAALYFLGPWIVVLILVPFLLLAKLFLRWLAIALVAFTVGAPSMSRADLFDDIPECQFEDCELASRPAKPIGLLLALLLSVFGGCGPSDPCPVEPQFWTDLGIGIYVDEGAAEAEWTSSPDLGERVDHLARIVADYASRDVHSLAGWTIVFRGPERFYCFGTAALGCTHYSGWMEVKTVAFMDCVEQSSLVHELLHALGVNGHTDPLWTDWVEVANSVTDCDVSPKLWYP